MDKKLISHSIAILTTPFYFAFILAIAYAIYNKEYSNIFAGTPILIFMTMFLYIIAGPCILLIEMYTKKVKMPQIIKGMFVTAIITFILTLLFIQGDSIDYTMIILGVISSVIYYFNEYSVTRYILNKIHCFNYRG